MAKENAAWQAFKDKKADDFKKVMHADMRAVYAQEIATKQTEMASMQKMGHAIVCHQRLQCCCRWSGYGHRHLHRDNRRHDWMDASGAYNAASV